MTTLQEAAMRKALDALEWCVEQGGGPICEHESGGVICFCKENSAIESLKSALAQQGEQQRIQELEQELAAEIELRGKLEQECVNWRVKYTNLEMAQQGEPVAWTLQSELEFLATGRASATMFSFTEPDQTFIPLYTAAPAPQAQPVAAQGVPEVGFGNMPAGERADEFRAFNEWYIQRKRASFPKDYDESRFANWAENYRHDSWRGWEARAMLAAAPQAHGPEVGFGTMPTGCACRWDADDNRVATCVRHQGWLDVVHEWAERAKAAEAALQSTQRELSDEQIIAIMESLGITVAGPASDAVIALTREVEAAHGIKKARGE